MKTEHNKSLLTKKRERRKEGSEAIYLYCLTCSSSLPLIKGMGVDGRNPLFFHYFPDIIAVLSTVSIEEFCAPSAESRMQDLSWVGPRVCRHEEVVEQVMRSSPVLPTRFGTLFSSLESLDRLLQTHHREILRFLRQVADKEEWSVKVLLDRAKAKEKRLSLILSKEAERLASMAPGKRYFCEQRIRAGIERDLGEWLKEVCGRVANELSDYASGFCQRRVLPRDMTKSIGAIILNWAFLIPRSALADFMARVKRANADHASQGLVLELSGPWPPYSFSPSLNQEPGS